MKKPFYIFWILLFFLFSGANHLKAAPSNTSVLDSGSISQQFEYVINKSSLYNEYRAVKSVSLNNLRNHVLDTLKNLNANLSSSQNKVKTLTTLTDSLKKDLEESNARYKKALKEKNSIGFLGISFSKYLYNTIVWIIIAALAFVVVSIFLAFRRNNQVTGRVKQDMLELKDEFERHRQSAREREEKMARQHLNEILKHKGQNPLR